jgi:DNA polymerase-3 subunit delta
MPSPARTKTAAGPPDVDGLSPKPVYLLFGGDEFLISTNARRLVNRLCPPAEQAFGLEIIEGQETTTAAAAVEAVAACRQALQTMGFFAGAKTVWFRDAALFSQVRVRDAEAVKEALDTLTALIRSGLGDGVHLVVSARGIDKRSGFYRGCREAGHLVEYAVPEKTYQVEARARETAVSLLAAEGLTAAPATVDLFVAKTGSDTRQLACEASKLAVYLGEAKEVTADDIRAVGSPSRDASSWDLQDALGHRNAAEAFRLVHQLLFQGETATGMIRQLEGRFRDLLIFRHCQERGWCTLKGRGNFQQVEWIDSPEAHSILGQLDRDPRDMNPWRAGRLASQAARYSPREILRIQELLAATHAELLRSSLPDRLILDLTLAKMFTPGYSAGGRSHR